MPFTRRRLLQFTTSAAALGLADSSAFRSLAAAETEPSVPADMIRFTPDIEPIVRLVEQTPREKCAAVMVEQLRKGLPYRHFLAAIFLATIRKTNSHHAAYMVHSAYQASQDLPPEEMLLPLFWAMDGFKWHQEFFPTPAVRDFPGAALPPEGAIAAFHDAMRKFDVEASERAVIALVRNHGLAQTMQEIWPYAGRDCSVIGHRAISAANSSRVLETIGAQHAEPVLRFVVQNFYAREGRQDGYYRANLARAEKLLEKLPAAWPAGRADPAAVAELATLLRQGKSEDGCTLAAKLMAGGISAQTIWDSVHVAAAELLFLHRSGTGMQTRPLHINTSVNALHHVFASALSARTRLVTLLQAAAWVGDFTRAQMGDKNLQGSLTELDGAQLTGSAAETVAGVFSGLPPHTYAYDAKTKSGPGHNLVNPAERVEASRKVYALATQHPESMSLFLRAARSWLAVKATVEAHDYKLPVALFEDYERVSPAWRPRLLAASVRWVHGRQSPDSPVIQRAREALGKAG